MTSATRVAVVRKHAPEQVRSALCLADVGKDYAKCRDELGHLINSIIQYDASGVPNPESSDEELEEKGASSSAASVPMEIDALIKGRRKD